MKIKKYTLFIGLVVTLIVLFVGTTKFFDYKYQKELLKNKEINIVFNTDLKYKDFTKVAVKSATVSKNPDSIYNINILCVDLTKEQCEEFNAFNDKDNNVYMNLIPLKLEMLNNIGNYEIRHSVTRTDLFKFLFPDILKDLDKVLYIDGDTIILEDLSDLYNTDIRKYALAAVKKSQGSPWHINLFPNTFFAIDLYKEITEYNCGVMLLNLKKFRKDNLSEKLIIAKNNDKKRDLQTETSFNEVIPYRKIKHLSPVYNARDFENLEINTFKKTYKPFIKRDTRSMDDFYKTAVIIHFAGKNKPWNTNDVRFFTDWWKYANMVNPNWEYGKDFMTKESEKK